MDTDTRHAGRATEHEIAEKIARVRAALDARALTHQAVDLLALHLGVDFEVAYAHLDRIAASRGVPDAVIAMQLIATEPEDWPTSR